jgi:hypothetical protein
MGRPTDATVGDATVRSRHGPDETRQIRGSYGRDDAMTRRIAANDNETIVDDNDTQGHRLAGNDNETVVDDNDTEGHRIAANDNETIVLA